MLILKINGNLYVASPAEPLDLTLNELKGYRITVSLEAFSHLKMCDVLTFIIFC